MKKIIVEMLPCFLIICIALWPPFAASKDFEVKENILFIILLNIFEQFNPQNVNNKD